MSSSSMNSSNANVAEDDRDYRGVRCRKPGKWVSEIRVPGSRDRLWLGTYKSPVAAAVAHDTAFFLLRGPSYPNGLNFPERVADLTWVSLSPRSVQKVASEIGMDYEAKLIGEREERELCVDDMEIIM